MQTEFFKDAEFMTAEEKKKVLKNWERFLSNGFQWNNFTSRLYEHLHLHCSFIAHYNRAGFYATYFEQPDDTAKFLKQFDKDYDCVSIELGMRVWLSGDCQDLNQAMCETAERYKAAIYARCGYEEKERDIKLADMLLAKHGVSR